MASAISCIGGLIKILLLALVLFLAAYFLFPDFYQRVIRGEQAAEEHIPDAVREAGQQIARTREGLERALEDAGLGREEISRIMDQIDAETMEKAVKDGIERGVETGGQFFDAIKDRVDFGSIDTDPVRRYFAERTSDIDFSRALKDLGRIFERGLTSFSEMIRDMVSQ